MNEIEINMNEIEIDLPKGFMNCGVSVDNKFFADTNESGDGWDTLSFPLPKPKHKWYIKKYEGKWYEKQKVILIDKHY